MNLLHLPSPQQAQQWCQQQRQQGHSIGFVPTMGALHAGHLSLLRAAQQQTDKAVVSIFVNPLQFDNPDDLAQYSAPLSSDLALLEQAGATMVFTGGAADFYPHGSTALASTALAAYPFAQGMEGTHRPCHFAGVRAIVRRLFTFVGACSAFFGEKDFQQLHIIKQLAKEMTMETAMEAAGEAGLIKVLACPISREPSGLARSSRNARLSAQGKRQAAVIYQALSAARTLWQAQQRQARTLRQAMLAVLNAAEISWEYAEVVNPDAWTPATPTAALSHARGLIAVEIEGVRLIDNLLLGREIADD